MSSSRTYLAIDLGASSGRGVAGQFNGQRLSLEEIHRFSNGPVQSNKRLYWDVLRLWSDVQAAMLAASQRFGDDIVSVGVDTWGVDFTLLGRNDELLGNPYHYRDPETAGILDHAFRTVSREEIFAATGLQFMEINTLFQLLAMRRAQSSLLDAAESLLMIPDFFHWLLTGEKANEFTDATTTQFLNPSSQDWSRDLLSRFDLPDSMLQSIIHPGTNLGALRPEIANATGLKSASVIVPGTHDTASAVMAVPAKGEVSNQPDWCYISSGTWSLMGVEVADPVISETCRELNFTNEGGVGGTIRLLKNITGLWLVQECQRVWARAGRKFDWNQLTQMAEEAQPLQGLINPDDAVFSAPDDMPVTIQEACARRGQPVPQDEGAIVRCALESLALCYRSVLGRLEQLTKGAIQKIHIVGGGTQNQQLCQMTANACNRLVLAGPVEATAIGNVMVQAIAAGDIESISQARQVISQSFPIAQYEPQNAAEWDNAYQRFVTLLDE
ncbi:MAG: rhamnulokinase [Pirellulaceae bacterium]|nr:rhamnulokinase [Pirellulaceae bacterium]